jgi:hypothetical protein
VAVMPVLLMVLLVGRPALISSFLPVLTPVVLRHCHD